MKDLETITAELNELSERAKAAVATAETDKSKYEEVKALLEGSEDKPGLKAQIDVLTRDREEAVRAEEFKAMRGKITDLQSVIEDLRKPAGNFTLPTDGSEGKSLDEIDANYSAKLGGKHSIFLDIRLANKGDQAAKERLTTGFENLNPEGKAMTEGTDAQGGYLVRPLLERQLLEARELDNVLRPLCSSINVTTNAIQLDQLTLSTTAGWVAELAQKPESTGMTIASVTATVFTAAGLATISNQLLADSNPAVDQLVTADLAKRLVALEETAFLSGTGTGQPLGILNTPGINAQTLATSATQIADLLDVILDSIAQVETYHGAPTALLMHPRTWTSILKSKDAQNAYYINPGAPAYGRSAVVDPRTVYNGPVKTLWGYPVVTSNRMPTNLGTGTNESRVIVGDFQEALILDRQGIAVDESSHVFFTTNQTVFRAEERVGFTAARTPTAFSVIGGPGLANG